MNARHSPETKRAVQAVFLQANLPLQHPLPPPRRGDSHGHHGGASPEQGCGHAAVGRVDRGSHRAASQPALPSRGFARRRAAVCSQRQGGPRGAHPASTKARSPGCSRLTTQHSGSRIPTVSGPPGTLPTSPGALEPRRPGPARGPLCLSPPRRPSLLPDGRSAPSSETVLASPASPPLAPSQESLSIPPRAYSFSCWRLPSGGLDKHSPFHLFFSSGSFGALLYLPKLPSSPELAGFGFFFFCGAGGEGGYFSGRLLLLGGNLFWLALTLTTLPTDNRSQSWYHFLQEPFPELSTTARGPRAPRAAPSPHPSGGGFLCVRVRVRVHVCVCVHARVYIPLQTVSVRMKGSVSSSSPLYT